MKRKPEPPGWTSNELSRITGISLRTLQWWDETGLVSPGRNGWARLYTEADALEVLIALRIREKGLGLAMARKALRFVRPRLGKVLAGGEGYLLTDGKISTVQPDSAGVIGYAKAAKKALLLIALHEELERIQISEPARKNIGAMRLSA